jgi:hypothetical protein
MRSQRTGGASVHWPAPPPTPDRAAIDRNFAGFNRIVVRAKQAARAGNAAEAAKLAAAAAHFAWGRHPGIFHSPSLERLLIEIGSSAGGLGQPVAAPLGDPSRVLHVMTAALAVGGHTRLARRWIEWDDGRLHAVALTGQLGPIPTDLAEAARGTGGQVVDISSNDPIQSALRLRELAAGYDSVVLHIHPHDVVPVLAFAGSGAPPVIFLNHADHVFWIGGAVSNVVANLRPAGERLALTRRGVAPERSALVPLPLPPPQRSLTKEAARQELGLSGRGLVGLTIASSYKFKAQGQLGFLDFAVPVVDQFPSLTWLVVGPVEDRVWSRARRATQNRLRALGPRTQVDVFYEAADLYVDSYPLGGLTSVLEATSYGVPAVGYCPYEGSARHFCIDDPAFEGEAVRAADHKTFLRELSRLVVDPRAREEAGRRAAKAVMAAHGGPSWLRRVESAYQQAASTPGPTLAANEPEVPATDDIDLWLPVLVPAPIPYAHLALAPARLRLQLRNELRTAGFPITTIEIVRTISQILRALTPGPIRRMARRVRGLRSRN